MTQTVVVKPIINSPFEERNRHYRFGEDGITDESVPGRWRSEYFVPIARPRGRTQQLAPDLWTRDRIRENGFITRVRDRVTPWRRGGHPGITTTTRRLLEYWTNPESQHKLFCQIEAAETAIYLTEVAQKLGDNWIANIVEIKGLEDEQDRAKHEAAKRWVKAVNNWAHPASGPSTSARTPPSPPASSRISSGHSKGGWQIL